MEPRDPQRHHGVRRAGQLLPLGRALALIALALPASGQSVDFEWEIFSRRIENETDAAQLEETLFELADWYHGVLDRDVTGFEESLHRASWVLASQSGWSCSTDDRIVYWDDSARFLEAQGRVDAAAYMAHQGTLLLLRERGLRTACERAEEVLARFPRAHGQHPAQLLDLGEWRRQLGEHGRAFDRFEQFERAVEKVEVADALVLRLHVFRALAYMDLGLPDRSGPSARRARRLADEMRDAGSATARDLILTDRLMVNQARASGDHDLAVERIEACLKNEALYATAPRDRAELMLLAGLSRLTLEVGNPRLEPRGAEEVRANLNGELLPALVAFAHFALIEDALRHGDVELAEAHEKEAAAVLESLRNDERATLEQDATLAALRARIAVVRGDDVSKLRGHLPKLEQAVDAMLRRWSDAPTLEGGVGFLLFGRRRAVVGDLMRLQIALDAERGPTQAFETLLRLQGMGTLARRDRIAPPPMEQVVATFGSDANGLLAYLPADGGSHVFTVDADGVKHAFLAEGSEIDEVRQRYVSHLFASAASFEGDRSDPTLVREERKRALALAQLLLPPHVAEQIAEWNHVTIVGSDTLGLVPFAWLPFGDDRYLGTTKPLAFVDSLPLAVVRAAEPRIAETQTDCILVAGVEPHARVTARWQEVGPLPKADPSLMAAYERRRTRTFERDDATGAAFEGAASTRVLQFLGHAVQDTGRERPVALVLAPTDGGDGLVWCEDVERLRSPELVVLTACRSGTGPQRRGDPGVTDMGGAWFTSGARAVVLSRADLTYGRAVEVSRVLHEQLFTNGRSPAEALRVARAQLVADGRDEAPFRDGLLRVVGLGHEPTFP